MTTEIQHAAARSLAVLTSALLATLAFVAFFTIGPRVESLLFPVVTDMKVIGMTRAGDTVTFRLSYEKTRTCEPDGFQAILDTGGDAPFAVVPIEFPDRRPDSPILRPIGHQVSGRLQVQIPHDVPATAMRLMFIHDCGFRWRTQTMTGPYPISPTY